MSDSTAPGPTARPRPKGKPSTLVIGIAITGILGLVAVYVLTRSGGSGSDAAAPPVTTAITSTTIEPSVSGGPTLPSVPPGDYGPFCAEIHAEAGPDATALTPDKLRDTFQKLDFDRLIGVAPDGLKASLTTLRATKADFIVLLEQVKSYKDIQPADLPDGFAPAMVQVAAVAAAKCVKSAGL